MICHCDSSSGHLTTRQEKNLTTGGFVIVINNDAGDNVQKHVETDEVKIRTKTNTKDG